ncbi:MAG: LexA family transcriptional regulator [Luteolibacter sp.]
MQFSIFLAKAMEERGLTQAQLGELSEVSQGAISRYLRKLSSPKAEEVIKLANALGVTTDWLLIGKEEGHSSKQFVEKISAAKKIALASSRSIDEAEENFDLIMHNGILTRRIPVLGWAHAGSATVYEEISLAHQETIPTDCRDPKAFGVALEGDSMSPRFCEGEMLVLMPSEEPYSGCFAVCRFADDGVVFRRLEFMGDQVRLVPLNTSYDPSTHSRKEFAWIYPVWGRWSQLWKSKAP